MSREKMIGGKRLNVYLDEESVYLAKIIGDGNVSAGIREALAKWATVRWPTVRWSTVKLSILQKSQQIQREDVHGTQPRQTTAL